MAATLFWIVFRNFLLTLVTLGIYSFWARAERRRYLFSQVALDGERFHYHGTGGELLVGWLKAIGLFVVLVAQMFVWAAIDAEAGPAVGAVILYLGVLAVLPLAIVGTWRYRASRSSYRGIRFSFRGSLGEAYGVYLKGVLLTTLTIGIYTPWFLTNLRRYLVTNTFYGTEPFRFDGEGSDLFLPFFVSGILTLPTLWLSQLWFICKRQFYFLGRTTITRVRLRVSATPASFMWLLLGSGVVQVLTLNIMGPWATVTRVRFLCDSMPFDGALQLAGVEQRAMAASATGEGLTGLLDTDLGIEL